MSHGELAQNEYRALAEFRFQIRKFLRFSEDAARQAGLEPQQHQALLALTGMPAGQRPTVSALAERLQIRHHSAVELLDRLVHSGLVVRTSDPSDHRLVLLSLTPKGESTVHRLALVHRAELESVGPALVRALQALLAADQSSAPAQPHASSSLVRRSHGRSRSGPPPERAPP